MPSPQEFGTLDGQTVQSVTLGAPDGFHARLISFGARLTELHVPDRSGRLADVVLGYDRLQDYVDSATYFGTTCGRFANRIRDGRLTLDGQTWQLDRNEGPNHLHGGKAGFDRKVWDIADLTDLSVTFAATSEDGEMGYPGRCALRCTYVLDPGGKLSVTMEAETSRTTVMNMVHHSYFNLAGQGSGPVTDQMIRFDSRFHTPVDDALLATGEVLSSTGTPFDFNDAKPIGRDLHQVPGGHGYDHNFCLASADPMHPCAEAWDPASGRRMVLTTSEPGVQFYTGGYLTEDMIGKRGRHLCQFAGFTLETQRFPGTPGFGHFPTGRLDPGQTYRHRMEFTFSADAGG
jgi:aldose 1-epimerase